MKRPAGAVVGSLLESPEVSPGFRLWQVASLWQQQIRAVLRPLDLTQAQFVLLASVAWLGREGAPVTQVQVAAHASTDVVMTSEVLRTLEGRDLVQRAPHPVDGRAKCLNVTPEGKGLVKKGIRAVEEVDRRFFNEPGPELRGLAELLRGIRK